MFTLLTNLNPRTRISGRTLFENRLYFILFDHPDDPNIESMICSAGIKEHLSWHRGNPIAELKVCNYIGLMRLFGEEYDVRSEKFLEHFSGIEQVLSITSDLDELSKQLSFSYSSPTYGLVETDWEQTQEDDIQKLVYLYYAWFEADPAERIPAQYERVKRHPSTVHRTVTEDVFLWKVKRATPRMAKQVAMSGGLNSTESPSNRGRLTSDKRQLTTDTPENQFVRMFFEYCEQLCLKIINSGMQIGAELSKKTNELLNSSRHILNDWFFREVSVPVQINTNSTILAGRPGYAQLLQYFIRSLFPFKQLYSNAIYSPTMGLSNVADLYEVWCFYKVAKEVLAGDIIASQARDIDGTGTIKYSTTFEDDHYQVVYNKTYSLSNHGSYSTALRPDVTVVSKNNDALFHFDAKYRISPRSSDTAEDIGFNYDDIKKMHTYLDAIYGSQSAVALYPGTKFIFYEKSTTPRAVSTIHADYSLKGVGAIPVRPGQTNDLFSSFFQRFFPSERS